MVRVIEKKNIPRGWQQTSIDKICDVLKGQGLSKGQLDSEGVNQCLLYGELFTTYNEVIKEIKSRTNSDEGIKSHAGDVLIPGSTTTVARDLAIASSLHKADVLLGGDINILRGRDGVYDSDFLAYYLTNYKKEELSRVAQGTTIIHLYGRGIRAIDIIIPKSKDEQKKIVDILSSVDREIQKIEEIIATSEKLKVGLMRELFTKGIRHTKFRNTGIGKVPAEWEVVKLEKVATVERGKFSHRPRNDPKFYGGDIPFIQTGDVVNSKGKIQSYKQSLNERGLAVSKMFSKGTIVLTIAANIGDTGILEFDSCFPDSLVGITVVREMNNIFLEYYLRTRKDYLNSIATQSAQKNINLQKLNPMLIVKPSVNEQEHIASILLSVDEKILVNKKLKGKLTLLRKGLIQDLLSGKVRTL